MSQDPESQPFPVGKWLIVGIVLSFLVGGIFFFTIASMRSGTLIPPDAAPYYYVHDAAPS